MGILVYFGIATSLFMLRWCHSVVRRWYDDATSKAEGDVLRYIRGDFLDISKCKVIWGWNDPTEVGQTISFRIQFYYNNGEPYAITESSKISVTITTSNLPPLTSVLEYASKSRQKQEWQQNEVKVSFTVSKSGSYLIAVTQDGNHIYGSPFHKVFIPGPLSPERTLLARTSHAALSVVVMTVEKNHRLMIDARDEYNNKCVDRLDKNDFNNLFDLRVREAINLSECPIFTWEIRSNGSAQLVLDIFMYQPGCYKALLTYKGDEIVNGSFDVLVINSVEAEEVDGYVEKRDLNTWFECRLFQELDCESNDLEDDLDLPLEGSPLLKRMKSTSDAFTFQRSRRSSSQRSKSHSSTQSKLKKVYCYVTPKQLIIKEFYFKIFPKRLFTFRLSPATKILCGNISELCDLPTLVISDASQPRVNLACSRRNVLVATFVGILHSNMGRSDTFEAKVSHFYKQLLQHHNFTNRRERSKKNLHVDRTDLLATSFKETRNFSVSDWCSEFVIEFKNEIGIDWGGLNKEWNELLCKSIFEAKSETTSSSGGCGLFTSLKDDPQALVLPTPSSVSGFKLKYYEFAGKVVGKCLLESAIGDDRARQVSARFARSFLAQLTGLPINFTYFESDDPDLFTTKVKYILENDVTDMELTFSEEVYNSNGSLDRIVELVRHGKNTLVTNENKQKYLNRVAQFRLSEAIKSEVEHFTKGLCSIVPDHLLSVFDESELELVMCGSSVISVDDMKLHSSASGLSTNVNNWFWAAVSSFTQADLARLVQFTTGCSQLPPDGFKALQPQFKISPLDYQFGGLPTAHTCFNELCIPIYDSYEELHRMLKLAITEGSTGFGLF